MRRASLATLALTLCTGLGCSGQGAGGGSGGAPATGGVPGVGGTPTADGPGTGGTADTGSGGAASGGAGAAGGNTGSGSAAGTGSAAGSGGSAPEPGGTFALRWEDAFDTLDTARWSAMTHSWDGNLAQFGKDNVTVTDGLLSIGLTASGDAEKPYSGVELRSAETLTFGKVEASVRFARGSAVVSSLVLIYTPWPPDDWNELDIEFLGKNSDRVQFNHMINIPPADPASGHLQFPELVTLDFDPSEDFHTYVIEWEPGEARFFIDGVLLHTASEEMARMVLPQNILLTIWASDSAAWAGPVNETTAPTTATYDWIRVYDYVPPN